MLLIQSINIPNQQFIRCGDQRGFTLVELLVALALTAILTVTIAYTFRVQAFTYKTQEAAAALQQNLRSAMFFIESDLRLAGFDPTRNATDANGDKAGVLFASTGTDSTPASIRLTMNRTASTNPAQYNSSISGGEVIYYMVDLVESDDIPKLRVQYGNSIIYQPVAEGIKDLQLAFFDNTNTGISPISGSDIIPSNRLGDIRRINVSLTGITGTLTEPGITKNLTSDVWCRNMGSR